MGACCTKTIGQDPGQSDARGREIAPHGCQGEESTNVAESKLKKYTELGALVTILRTGAVRLVMAEFVVRQYYHTTEPMPCCQDLPEEAFLHIEDLTDEEIAKLTIFVLSYCWITPEHPDPERYHLKDVARILEVYLRCPPDGGLDNYEHWRSRGYALGGRGQPVAVFWDWCSLPQDKPKGRRALEETAVFEQGLRTVNSWYAHEFTIVLLLTTLPEGAARPSYDGSGWTTFERSVASVITPGPRLLNVDDGARANLDKLKDGSRSSDLDFKHRVVDHCQDTARGAPREPRAFNALIRGTRVTNGADIDKVLIPKYEETFSEVIGEAGAISLCSCGLSTKAAGETLRVAKAHCTQLRKLSMAWNREMNLSLEEIGASCKALVHLDLTNCPGASGNLSTLGKHAQQLEILKLHSTGVDGELASLGCHKRLKALDLSWTKCSGDVAGVAGLQQLTHLDLKVTRVKGDIAALAGLGALESLDLSRTKVMGDVAGLASLGALESLDLHMTEVAGDVAGLVGLGALERLDLEMTKVTGDVAGLAGLGALKTFNLDMTKATGDLAGLAGLGALEGLFLHGTEVFGNASSLKGLKHLRVLDFDGTDAEAVEEEEEGEQAIRY